MQVLMLYRLYLNLFAIRKQNFVERKFMADPGDFYAHYCALQA